MGSWRIRRPNNGASVQATVREPRMNRANQAPTRSPRELGHRRRRASQTAVLARPGVRRDDPVPGVVEVTQQGDSRIGAGVTLYAESPEHLLDRAPGFHLDRCAVEIHPPSSRAPRHPGGGLAAQATVSERRLTPRR